MILYILVDTSGSMEGAKIGALNDLMDNIISELNDIDSSLRSEMKIAVLQFARSVETVIWTLSKKQFTLYYG